MSATQIIAERPQAHDERALVGVGIPDELVALLLREGHILDVAKDVDDAHAGGDGSNVHITGLLDRVLGMMEAGIRPVYVFDGRPPRLKSDELHARRQTQTAYREASFVARELGIDANARAARAAAVASAASAQLAEAETAAALTSLAAAAAARRVAEAAAAQNSLAAAVRGAIEAEAAATACAAAASTAAARAASTATARAAALRAPPAGARLVLAPREVETIDLCSGATERPASTLDDVY
ncbi:hypothetical protein T492DRAFT_1074195 [Pavlovales sp. CCMP2436]|nr:hypothetical protein T492DRAFT_1074195 [Pavlovales sp. CCMP2436]